MKLFSIVQSLLHRFGLHPRRWLAAFVSYPQFLGYVRPQLAWSSGEEFLVRRKLLARAWEPRTLRAPVGKRILALCPHPDDESIGAGGFLLAHSDISEIHLVCVYNGEGGGRLVDESGMDAESAARRMTETRRAEFGKVAHALHAASVRHLGLPADDFPCSTAATSQLRTIVDEIQPDLVLLPWFLDDHTDHRRVNLLLAWACPDLDAAVLAYEIWSLLEPNAVFDISQQLSAKLALIRFYESQLRTVDYVSYALGLARVRAYHAAVQTRRGGAAEAFVALPGRDYCEWVRELYGAPGRLRDGAEQLLGLVPTSTPAAAR